MGQKVHPYGFRLARRKNWKSVWYADKDYADFLQGDIKVRSLIREELRNAGLESIEIQRSPNNLEITVFVAKPGMVIGRRGSGIEKLKDLLQAEVKEKLKLDVQEVKQPNLSARLIADELTRQIERRMPYKRIVNRIIQKVIDAGAKGVKIATSGRLNGVEIARTEKRVKGVVPTSTISSEIDFAQATAFTKYGTVGVKVWVNRDKEK